MKVLITGVSRGIGKAMVSRFLDEGHTCIGLTRDAKRVSSDLVNNNRFKVIEWDPINIDSLNETHMTVLEDIDILINNAAMMLVKPISDTTQGDLAKVLDVNVIAPYQLIRKLKNRNAFSHGAHVVNLSSMGGFQGAQKFPTLSAYSISKAALVAMTESMAVEIPSLSINCLCLGAVQTEMLKQAFPDYQSEISDGDMAKFIVGFALNDTKLMSGCVVPVKKFDPN